jgi:hypothetical protein
LNFDLCISFQALNGKLEGIQDLCSHLNPQRLIPEMDLLEDALAEEALPEEGTQIQIFLSNINIT